MLSKLKNIAETSRQKLGGLLRFCTSNHWGLFAFVLAFGLGLFFLNLTLARTYALKHLKLEIQNIGNYLNEFDLDMAYGELDTSAIYTRPLLMMKDFEIYQPGGWSFKIPLLKIKSSIWNSHRFYVILGNQQTLQIGDESIKIISDNAEFQIITNQNNHLEQLLAQIKDIDVKNYFKIKELNFAGRRIGSHNETGSQLSLFENHVEAKEFQFNGLLNYPLTSTINRLYFKTNFIGWLEPGESLSATMEEWLHRGGYIAIPNLIVNWEPLNLVGRGEINFNEKLIPSLHLMTSSKALMKLLDDLQAHHMLDRKGVFVAKILLGNKAFKLQEADQHLTVMTPIDFRDGKIAVENITLRDFKTQTVPTQP